MIATASAFSLDRPVADGASPLPEPDTPGRSSADATWATGAARLVPLAGDELDDVATEWGGLSVAALLARASRAGVAIGASEEDDRVSAPHGRRRPIALARAYTEGRAVEARGVERISPSVGRLVRHVLDAFGTPVQRAVATLVLVPEGAAVRRELDRPGLVVSVGGDARIVVGPASSDSPLRAPSDASGPARRPSTVPATLLPEGGAVTLVATEPAIVLAIAITPEPAYRVVLQLLGAELARRPGWSEPLPGLLEEGARGAPARARLGELLDGLAAELRARFDPRELAPSYRQLEHRTRLAAMPGAKARRVRRAHSGGFYDDSEWGVPRIARRPDDIHVVTYMRSGTTWLQMILFQLLTDGELDRLGHMYEFSPFPASELRFLGSAERIESLPGPRVLKSHLPFDEVYSPEGRFLYVARSAMDVALSTYHHRADMGDGPVPFDVFVDEFLESGAWFEDVARWWAHRDRPNVLFLEYQDLLDDRRTAILRVAQFLGIDVPEERLARALERSSFAWMKAHEDKLDHFEGLRWIREQRARSGFVRRGRSAEGQLHLDARQRRRFAEAYARHLGHTTLALRGDETRPPEGETR